MEGPVTPQPSWGWRFPKVLLPCLIRFGGHLLRSPTEAERERHRPQFQELQRCLFLCRRYQSISATGIALFEEASPCGYSRKRLRSPINREKHCSKHNRQAETQATGESLRQRSRGTRGSEKLRRRKPRRWTGAILDSWKRQQRC